MKFTTACWPLLVVLLSVVAPLEGQVTRERQVPIAPESGVLEVDPGLRGALGLFPGVEGFVRARLFETDGGARFLEIEARVDGSLVRTRQPIDAESLASLRATIAAGPGPGGPGATGSTDGRTGLIIGQSLLGIGYYGWAVAEMLDTQGSRETLGAYLLTAGASFALPWWLTSGRTVTPAHSSLSFWGASRGVLYGLAAAEALDPDRGEYDPTRPDEEPDDDVQHVLGVGTSLAGAVLGFKAVDWTGASEAEAHLWGTLGDFGLAYGYATGLATGLFDGTPRCFEDVCGTNEFESTTGGHLVGTAIGLGSLWAAGRWAPADRYTVGDARALRSFGVLGAQTVLPFLWGWSEDGEEHEQALVGAMAAGSVAGLYLGDRVLADRSLSGGDGWLVLTGHLAGALGATGLAYIVSDEGDENETALISAAAIGGLAGALGTLYLISDPDPSGQGPSREDSSTRPRVLVEGPAAQAVAGLLLGRSAHGPTRHIPLLTIRF